ncbi:MAG: hypothetical protein ACI95S_001807, partial [Dinoroseobacter sp.]
SQRPFEVGGFSSLIADMPQSSFGVQPAFPK